MSTENKSPEATGGDRALALRIHVPNMGVTVEHLTAQLASHREQAVASALSAQSAELEALKATVDRLNAELRIEREAHKDSISRASLPWEGQILSLRERVKELESQLTMSTQAAANRLATALRGAGEEK